MKNGKLKAVVVGLGFGGAFVPIWRDHPDVGEVGVCELDPKLRARVAAEYGISLIYPSLDEVLADETVDAVHLVTAIPDHAEQTVRVLDAGKHCACTVPMATTMEGIQAIRGAVERSGKKYMMMETTLYTYQYLYVKRLLESGELGRVQFLRGSHYQDMENWPSYWAGLPTPVEIIEDLPNDFSSLPEPLWRYTVGGDYDPTNPQLSLKKGAGGGHHGSHPHLVHEFVRSIVEDRAPAVDWSLAANITAAGILAHQSALLGGGWISLPGCASAQQEKPDRIHTRSHPAQKNKNKQKTGLQRSDSRFLLRPVFGTCLLGGAAWRQPPLFAYSPNSSLILSKKLLRLV